MPTIRAHYRGYIIEFDPPPIGSRACDWQFVHQDYGGPEDGQCGCGPTLDDCKAQIDDLEEDA